MKAPLTVGCTSTRVPPSPLVIPLPPCASCSGVERSSIRQLGDHDGGSFCSGGSCPPRFLFVSKDRQQLFWWSHTTRRGDWKNFSHDDDDDDNGVEGDRNGQQETTNVERDDLLFAAQPSSPSLNGTDVSTDQKNVALNTSEFSHRDENNQGEVVKEHSSSMQTHLLKGESLPASSALEFDAIGKDSLANSVITEDEKNDSSCSNTIKNTEGLTTTIPSAVAAEGTVRENFIQQVPVNAGDSDDEGQKMHLNSTLHSSRTCWMKHQDEGGSEMKLEPFSFSLSLHDEAEWRTPSRSRQMNRSPSVDKKGKKTKAAVLPLSIPLWTCDSLQQMVSERSREEPERTNEVLSLPQARDQGHLERDENGPEKLSYDRIQNVLINPSLNTTELSRVEAYMQPTVIASDTPYPKSGSNLSPFLSCIPALLPSFETCQKGHAIEVVIITEWGSVIRFFLNNIVCTSCFKEFVKYISHRQGAEASSDVTDFLSDGINPKGSSYDSADENSVANTQNEKTKKSISFASLVFARTPEHIFRMSPRISSMVTHSTILTTLSSSSHQRRRILASETSGDGYSQGALSSSRRAALKYSDHTNRNTGGSCSTEGSGTVGTVMLLLAFYLQEERLTEILKLEDPFPIVLLDFPILGVEKKSEKPEMLGNRVSRVVKDLGARKTTEKNKLFLSSSKLIPSCPPPFIPSTAAAASLAANMETTTKLSSFSPFFTSLCSKRLEKSSPTNGMSTLSSSQRRRDSFPVPSSSSSSLWCRPSPATYSSGCGSFRVLCRCSGRLSSFLWDPLQLHLILIYTTSTPSPHADPHRVPPNGYAVIPPVHLSSQKRSEGSMDSFHSSTLAKHSVVVEIFSWYEERVIHSSFPSSPVFTSALCWSTLKHGRPSPNCALIVPGSAGDGEGNSVFSLWIGTDKGHVVVLPLCFSSCFDASFTSTSSSTFPTTLPVHHQRKSTSPSLRSSPSRSLSSMPSRADGRVLELPSCPVRPSPLCQEQEEILFFSSTSMPAGDTAENVEIDGAVDGATTRPLSSSSSCLFHGPVANSGPSTSTTIVRSSCISAMKKLFLMVGGREVWGYRESEEYFLVWDARRGTPLRQVPLPVGWGGGGGGVREEGHSLSSKPLLRSPFCGGMDSRGDSWGVTSTSVTIEYVWLFGFPGPSQRSSGTFLRHDVEQKNPKRESHPHPKEGEESAAKPSPEKADGNNDGKTESNAEDHHRHPYKERHDSAILHACANTTSACSAVSLLLPQACIQHWVPSSTQNPLWLEQRELRRYAQESKAVQTAVSEILSFLYAPIYQAKLQMEMRQRKEEKSKKDLLLSLSREKESKLSSPFVPQDRDDVGIAALGDHSAAYLPESKNGAEDELVRHSALRRAFATSTTSSEKEGERNDCHPHGSKSVIFHPTHITTAARDASPDWMRRSPPDVFRRKGSEGDAGNDMENSALLEQLTAIQKRVEEYEWCKEIMISSLLSFSSCAPRSLPSSALDAFSIVQLVEMLFERYSTADEKEREMKWHSVPTSSARKHSHAEPPLECSPMEGGTSCREINPDISHLLTKDMSREEEKKIRMEVTANNSLPFYSFMNRVQSLWMSWVSPPYSILQGTAETGVEIGETLSHLARHPNTQKKNGYVCSDGDDSESSFYKEGETTKDKREIRSTWNPENGASSTPPETLEDVCGWLHYLVTCAQREPLAPSATQRQTAETREGVATTRRDRTECLAVLSNPLQDLSFSSSSSSSSSSFVLGTTYACSEENKQKKKTGKYNWKNATDDTVNCSNRLCQKERGAEHVTTPMRKINEKTEENKVFGTLSSLIYHKGSDHEENQEKAYENSPHHYDHCHPFHKEEEYENPYRSSSLNATACLEVLLEDAQQCRAAAEDELQSVSRQLSVTKDVLAVHQEQVSLLKKSLAASHQAAEKSAIEASTLMALEGRLASLSTELLATKSSLLSSEERVEQQRNEIIHLREQVNSYQLMEQNYQEKEQLAMHAMEEFRSTENDIMAEMEELLYAAKSITAAQEGKSWQAMNDMKNDSSKTNSSSHFGYYCHPNATEDSSGFIQIEEKTGIDPDRCIKDGNQKRGREGTKTPHEKEEECSNLAEMDSNVVHHNRDYFNELQEAVANCYLFVVNRLKSQKQYFRDVKSNLISVPL